MKHWFTADWHLGSFNIIGYAKRPFFSASDAAQKLVYNCNSTATSRADVVFHVGDFWLSGVDRHGKDEDVNELVHGVDKYVGSVNARLVLLTGNHDESNCDTDLKSMTVDLNQNYVNVTVAHYPSYLDFYRYVGNGNRNSLSKNFIRLHPKLANLHIHLCGHVHDRWLLNYDKIHHVLNVNVGVDVWNYYPVKDSSLTEMLDFVFDDSGPNRTDFSRTFTWTRLDFENFRKCQDHDRKILRMQRKAERHASKGLTPEECEKRKIEAMKAKGLI